MNGTALYWGLARNVRMRRATAKADSRTHAECVSIVEMKAQTIPLDLPGTALKQRTEGKPLNGLSNASLIWNNRENPVWYLWRKGLRGERNWKTVGKRLALHEWPAAYIIINVHCCAVTKALIALKKGQGESSLAQASCLSGAGD